MENRNFPQRWPLRIENYFFCVKRQKKVILIEKFGEGLFTTKWDGGLEKTSRKVWSDIGAWGLITES